MGFVNKRDNKLVKKVIAKQMEHHNESLSAHVKLLDEYRNENNRLKAINRRLNKQIKDLKEQLKTKTND